MQEDEWMDAYLGTDAQGEQLREELQAQLQLAGIGQARFASWGSKLRAQPGASQRGRLVSRGLARSHFLARTRLRRPEDQTPANGFSRSTAPWRQYAAKILRARGGHIHGRHTTERCV